MIRRQVVRAFVGSSAASLLPVWSGAAAAEEPNSARSWVIGSSVGLSGPLASLGQELKQGMDAAIAQVNARGGVAGRELNLQVLDDGYAPQRTQENVRKLLAEGSALALLSCMGTANNQAILPLVDEAQIPYVAPQSGASALRQAQLRSVFHVRVGYADEARRLIEKLGDMGFDSLAVVSQETTFGREFLADVVASAEARKVRLVAQVALDADARRAPEVVQQVLAAKPSAVVLGTAGDASVALVKQFRKLSPSLPLAASSVALSGENLRQLGALSSGLALTLVLPDAGRTSVGLVRDYQKAMRAIGQTAFSSRSLEGYVNARVLIEGLERCGKDLSRSRLRSALAGIRNLDLGGLVIDYSAPAPYVGSRYLELGVLGAGGRLLG